MRHLAPLALIALLALCACTSGPGPAPQAPSAGVVAPAPPPRQTYLVRRVIYGDTIEVEDDSGIRTRIRLRNVNAPELHQPGGPEAKDALSAKLLGKRVSLKAYARDRYGRTVATVATVAGP